MLPCVIATLCIMSCHGAGNLITKTLKDNNGAYSTTISPDKKGATSEEKHSKMELRSPPDEDLLELMVRIAETPEEWERIHTVLKELGIEKRRKQTKHKAVGSENTTTANNSNSQAQSESSSSKSSTRTENRLGSPTTIRPTTDRIEFAKNNPTRREISVVGTKFKKKKKDDRRKKGARGHGRGRGTRQHHHDNGVWPKLHRPKKKDRSRRIEARSTTDNDDRGDQTYNWLQMIRLRHDKVDDPGPGAASIDLQLDEDFRGDNHVSWVPESFSYSPHASSYQIPAEKRQEETGEEEEEEEDEVRKREEEEESHTESSAAGAAVSSSSWPEKDKVRPTFSYHRVTVSPRESYKASASAYVAVSVVKNNATLLEPQKTHTAPWSHSRHLHRIQEQLKSLSTSKAKLRHHWYEKEEFNDPVFDQGEGNTGSTT